MLLPYSYFYYKNTTPTPCSALYTNEADTFTWAGSIPSSLALAFFESEPKAISHEGDGPISPHQTCLAFLWVYSFVFFSTILFPGPKSSPSLGLHEHLNYNAQMAFFCLNGTYSTFIFLKFFKASPQGQHCVTCSIGANGA